MKPQFDKDLTVFDDGSQQILKVGGPIDLSGTEEDVYIWVRISQPPTETAPAVKAVDVFGQGSAALEHNHIDDLVKVARQAPDEGGPRWTADVFPVHGKFVDGQARAEATMIVRDSEAEGGMEFNVWWWENVGL